MLAGFLTGLSLIVAIGAQNAYVLRQGIRREHVGAVALLCSTADAVLILAGVTGIGTIVERAPVVLDVVRWAGRPSCSATPSSRCGGRCTPASCTRPRVVRGSGCARC